MFRKKRLSEGLSVWLCRWLAAWAAVFSLAALLVSSGTALAQQAVSPAYGVDEVFFGTGGTGDDNCSVAYCAKTSTGELTTGFPNSTDYAVRAGNNTNREEYIEMVVNNGGTNFGSLTTSSAATATSSVSVKAYLASGYILTNGSDPPLNSAAIPHTLTALATPTAYNASAEQFGINLAANTSPATFGAVPSQVPDSTFSYGTAASGYNTANLFKYVKGDTIASSTRSSGETNYTISYMFKINDTTPAGRYTFNHVIVATATY